MLDLDAAPPAGAVPVELPELKRRLVADSLEELLAPDFEYRLPGRRPISRKRYIAMQRRCGKLLHVDSTDVESFFSEPGEEAVWVRMAQRFRPPRGGPLDVAWLDRWTLTPDRGQVRVMELIAFTRVR